MRFLFLLFPFLLQAGIWSESLTPKAQRAKDVLEEFEPIIKQVLDDYLVPGVAIGIVVDGQVAYAKGFGFRDLEKQLPATQETLFAIGSCTKAFTTFVMGNLVDEGFVEWDQPVIDILPDFRLQDQYATTNITLRDLLTHRTGMPRHEFAWYNSKIDKNEVLRRIRYLQPSYDIRERYQYGNLMYFTAGLAMERVTKKSWDALIREKILIPLEMVHTNFSVDDMQKTNNFSYPYSEKNEKLKKMNFRNISLISAAGALNSNVVDMTHWLQMQLAGGIYKNRSLISPATLQELFAPQVIIPGMRESKATHLTAYGFGWLVTSYRGHYYVSHDAVTDGFTSMVGLFPEEGIGIVILSNKNMTAFPRYLSMEISDRLLELPKIDWLQEGKDNIRKNRESIREKKGREDLNYKTETHPCHPIQDYAGVYENPGYGQLYVELVNGDLEITFNELEFVLKHCHYDVFKIVEEKQDMIISLEGTPFTFCNNANGDIGEVSVPFEPNADAIVFKRVMGNQHAALERLRKFVGFYEIYGYTVEIAIRNGVLQAIIPGQPNYELVPSNENEFAVKTMIGSTVRFVLSEDDKVKEVLLIQPYGCFSAKPKKVG